MDFHDKLQLFTKQYAYLQNSLSHWRKYCKCHKNVNTSVTVATNISAKNIPKKGITSLRKQKVTNYEGCL